MLRIAIDFDDTFSADVTMWRQIVGIMKKAGHEVKIVTARGAEGKVYETDYGSVKVRRGNNADIYKAIEGLDIDVIYCGWKQKRDVCFHEHKWMPHIWIDDMPEAVVESFLLK